MPPSRPRSEKWCRRARSRQRDMGRSISACANPRRNWSGSGGPSMTGGAVGQHEAAPQGELLPRVERGEATSTDGDLSGPSRKSSVFRTTTTSRSEAAPLRQSSRTHCWPPRPFRGFGRHGWAGPGGLQVEEDQRCGTKKSVRQVLVARVGTLGVPSTSWRTPGADPSLN